MSDNSKGELIKKKNTTSPKKKLVIKKVKKVIIKKQPTKITDEEQIEIIEDTRINAVDNINTINEKKSIHLNEQLSGDKKKYYR
jgi:hypothetical protein